MAIQRESQRHLKLLTSPWFLMAVIGVAVVANQVAFAETAAQKFYPNGRYGRRSDIPPAYPSRFAVAPAPHQPSEEMACTYTGITNLFRCKSRESGEEELQH